MKKCLALILLFSAFFSTPSYAAESNSYDYDRKVLASMFHPPETFFGSYEFYSLLQTELKNGVTKHFLKTGRNYGSSEQCIFYFLAVTYLEGLFNADDGYRNTKTGKISKKWVDESASYDNKIADAYEMLLGDVLQESGLSRSSELDVRSLFSNDKLKKLLPKLEYDFDDKTIVEVLKEYRKSLRVGFKIMTEEFYEDFKTYLTFKDPNKNPFRNAEAWTEFRTRYFDNLSSEALDKQYFWLAFFDALMALDR